MSAVKEASSTKTIPSFNPAEFIEKLPIFSESIYHHDHIEASPNLSLQIEELRSLVRKLREMFLQGKRDQAAKICQSIICDGKPNITSDCPEDFFLELVFLHRQLLRGMKLLEQLSGREFAYFDEYFKTHRALQNLEILMNEYHNEFPMHLPIFFEQGPIHRTVIMVTNGGVSEVNGIYAFRENFNNAGYYHHNSVLDGKPTCFYILRSKTKNANNRYCWHLYSRPISPTSQQGSALLYYAYSESAKLPPTKNWKKSPASLPEPVPIFTVSTKDAIHKARLGETNENIRDRKESKSGVEEVEDFWCKIECEK